ncbi:MAG: exosortase/archaeosortase family protein [Pseudomonas sp.]
MKVKVFARERASFPNLSGNLALPVITTAAAFFTLNALPLLSLAQDWWRDPEAAHGLLLAPLALVLAYRAGINTRARPQWMLGLFVVAAGVCLRYLADLAAEFYTLRMSVLIMLAGIVIFHYGIRQVLHWWLPAALLVLSIPLPQVAIGALAFPLQLKASALGASLLVWRDVPVTLAGNIIHLPGQSLFVTEACSGLRSLSALISLGLLMGAFWLNHASSRILILALAVPIAVVLNGIRVFLTGYLVHYVSPSMGSALIHWTEGWVMFAVAFAAVGGLTALVVKLETLRKAHRS